jgi:para-aminobenzoate synthetase/4-amino-4-deoxychorismate lyase
MNKNQVVLHDATARQWLQFQNPQQVIQATSVDEVIAKLQQVEQLIQQKGWYAAGFISYEAAPAFDSALPAKMPDPSFPLIWFGLYDSPEAIPSPSNSQYSDVQLDWIPSISRSDYARAIAQVKSYIARGDTYQVNFTLRLHTPFTDDSWTFFCQLVQTQQADYAAYIDTGQFAICSVSPELFFQLDGDQLISRPMKGTASRGLAFVDDKAQAEWLHNSQKNRAENVMIVDMIRNDMGRVARYGSVDVPSLFEVERYPTVWQMTSTVTASTSASFSEILTALFPCASITGAPKRRTMEIIAELESVPRRIYTGGVGFVAPCRRAQFNVAIRTVLVDREAGAAEYGVGGGIVWDSETGDEYNECQIKARVLTENRPEFSLLETMLWTPDDGYFLLDYHLRRLFVSALYFGYPADLNKIQTELIMLADSLPCERYRVRLLVDKDGGITCQSFPLVGSPPVEPARIKLSPDPIDSRDPFLYHKTTHRQVYEAAQASCADYCDDVLLWNERGEITEACIANIVVEVGGKLVTPPVKSGLLTGTFRNWLLDQGEIEERVVLIGELKQAKKIFLINSVRKWREAVLME